MFNTTVKTNTKKPKPKFLNKLFLLTTRLLLKSVHKLIKCIFFPYKFNKMKYFVLQI